MIWRSARFGIFCVLFGVVAGLVGCAKAGDEGKLTGEPGALRVSPDGIEASEPALVALDDGRVAIAYVVKEGEAGDLYVRLFDPATAALSEPLRVNTAAGEVKTWYGDPPTIATGPGGKIYIGWTARYPDGAKGTMLYLSISQDGGRTFGAPVRVDDDEVPASHGMHSIAIGADGTVYFAWLDERYLRSRKSPAESKPHGQDGRESPHPAEAEVEPNAELYFAASADGSSFAGKNRRLDGDVCPCCKTSIAVSEKGKIAIGYRKVFGGEYRHIAVNVLNETAGSFVGPTQVSDDGWRINACPVSGPALRFDGEVLNVSWFSGGEAGPQGIYYSRSTDYGQTFAERMLVEANHTGGQPSWASDSLFWSSDGDVRTARIAKTEIPTVSSAGVGKNVVAARAGSRPFYAFVAARGDVKSVWLASVE